MEKKEYLIATYGAFARFQNENEISEGLEASRPKRRYGEHYEPLGDSDHDNHPDRSTYEECS